MAEGERSLAQSTSPVVLVDGVHLFSTEYLAKPAFCAHCDELIWGTAHHAYQCRGAPRSELTSPPALVLAEPGSLSFPPHAQPPCHSGTM